MKQKSVKVIRKHKVRIDCCFRFNTGSTSNHKIKHKTFTVGNFIKHEEENSLQKAEASLAP